MLRPAVLVAAVALLAALAPGTAQAAETYPDSISTPRCRWNGSRSTAWRPRRPGSTRRRYGRCSARTRVLVVPYAPLDLPAGERIDLVDAPVHAWARDRDLDVVLVTGTHVRILGEGTVALLTGP